MSTIIRDEIAALSSYHVQDAAGFIKLDAMENPFDFPLELRSLLAEQLANAAINRYPDASAEKLTASIRRAMHIPEMCDILLGNGSDEIIQMIAMAVAKPNAKLLSIEPAFVMFKMIATFCGMQYVGVPLTPDFAIDRESTLAAVKMHQPAAIFLAYPNNPTGNLFDDDVIDDIIRASTGLVVIDEAYFAFSSRSFLTKLHLYPNVVLMRTVSKLGLAGLRLGMLIGDKKWLREIDKVRLPYNINVFTQIAATFALDNIASFTAQTNLLVGERAKMATGIDAIFATHKDAKRFESDANFILIRLPATHDASAVFNHLRSKKILVKNTSAGHPLLANTLRITVGAPTENQAFLYELNKALAI
jgi:histidinol-phosphate aminotransferase